MARRADAARNAELLLASARELFAEQGPEAALDEVARRAGVGNATLYRNFPTRGDLLVAVYADEVTALCDRGTVLLAASSPGDALYHWLDDFVVHIATKRDLAMVVTGGGEERRTELFDRWHESMRSIARRLLTRARKSGAVRPGLKVDDLLALVSATAIAATGARDARRLLRLLWTGFATPVPGAAGE